jgi:hypothetical protein
VTPATRPRLVTERLNDGDAEPVIVADFVRFSGTPRFSAVLSSGDHRHPIYAVDPVTDLARSGAYLPLADLAAGYADEFLAANATPGRTVVIGYCTAAALALRIAGRLGATTDVLAVLVRPMWPDADMIRSDFAEFRAGMGAAEVPAPDLGGDPGATLRRLERVLEADLHAVARAHGLDESSSALPEMLARYRAWLGFLLTSRSAIEQSWRGELPLKVLTGAAGCTYVPWFDHGSYKVTRLSLPADEPLAAACLAGAALAQIQSGGT